MIRTKDLSLRSLAHIGDAVFEVYARDITIHKTLKPKILHQITVSIVNAKFQAFLLDELEAWLNEVEQNIVRRARNLTVTTARRTNQALHRRSTAFEVLVGFLYLNDKERLELLYEKVTPIVNNEIDSKLDVSK